MELVNSFAYTQEEPWSCSEKMQGHKIKVCPFLKIKVCPFLNSGDNLLSQRYLKQVFSAQLAFLWAVF